MTRDKFIRKWLANPQKQYNEQHRDEMRNDLDAVISWGQNTKSHSIVSELTDEQQFYITLIAILNTELVDERIITPTQKMQIETYMLSKQKSVVQVTINEP